MAIKPEMIGQSLPPTTFEVDRGKIREFASAIGDENPIYQEIGAAREAGYADLPIPLTFPTTFGFWGKKAKEAPAGDFGFPLSRVLHGEEEYTYLAPVYPGDTLTGVRKLLQVDEKQGKSGKMEIATVETIYTNQNGQEVLRARSVVVIR